MASVVVGLGKTGASCLRYFAKHGIAAAATDSRQSPPGLAELGPLARTLDIRLGSFDLSLLDGASQVLMSPGVSLDEPIVRAARARGIEVLGDVELFARAVHAPVIGITGTNGKSTVTSLVAAMASAAGRRVLAGGNLGTPALDLLDQPAPDLYVLELSSFQLETTTSLELMGAVVLNVTADHMDRYATVLDYARAKERIFAHASTVVRNADDPLVMAMGGAANRRRNRGRAEGGDLFHAAHRMRIIRLLREGRADFSVPPRRCGARDGTHEDHRSAQRRQCPGRAGIGRCRRSAARRHAAGARELSGSAAPFRLDRRLRAACAMWTIPRAPTSAPRSRPSTACRDRWWSSRAVCRRDRTSRRSPRRSRARSGTSS